MDRNFHFYNAANILHVAFPVTARSAFTQFDLHYAEVRGGVEPWLMARWKGRVDFLLSVIELLFLSLTLRRYKAKRVKTRCSQEGWISLSQDFRGRGRPSGIFFWFLQN